MSLPPELIQQLSEEVRVGDIVEIIGEFELSLMYPLSVEFMLSPEEDIKNKIKSELERNGYRVLDIGVTVPKYYYLNDYSIPSSVILDVVIEKVGGGTPVWAVVLIIISALAALGFVIDRIAWITYYKLYSQYVEEVGIPTQPPAPPSPVPSIPSIPTELIGLAVLGGIIYALSRRRE